MLKFVTLVAECVTLIAFVENVSKHNYGLLCLNVLALAIFSTVRQMKKS